MRNLLWLCALSAVAVTALSLAACKSSSRRTRATGSDNLAMRLDRSDWMVNQDTRVSMIRAANAPNRPPEHIGFLVERQYRQMRGGPEFKMYSITTLNRDEQIGHIDQLGRAVRYEPRRNGGFESVDVGSNTLERNIQAIFDTKFRITVVPTTQRRIAFDRLDANSDGKLQRAETAEFGHRITGADTNGDGVVDFEEFNAVDVL